MLFNSIEYLFCFLPIVFIIYFVLNNFKFYNSAKIFLLFASIYFYGSYKWDYVYIIIVSILINYAVSLFFKKDSTQLKKKLLLITAVCLDIGVLLFFKYFSFLKEALSAIDFTYINTMKIAMPLGISFFMIQQISYLVDCYKGKIKQTDLSDYALFICFFPQLIAGPIVRHNEMIPQFNNPEKKKISQNNIYIGLFLITAGLIKKSVLADGFIPFIDYVTTYKIFYDFYTAWLLTISKVLQGYFDFSAYCDLALGSAFLFNISLPWNFNSPFQASSIIDFWRRWNMTLMRFLRTYIYEPVGGDRKGIIKTCRNILIVFLIFGLWLGFKSTLYGLLNGIFVCINKLWQTLRIKTNKYAAKVLTLFTILFSASFLCTTSMQDTIRLVKSMLSIDATHAKMYFEGINLIFAPVSPFMVKLNMLLFVVSIILVFFVKNSNILARQYAKADNIFYTFLLVIGFLYGVLSITKGTEFIYFIF